MAALAVGRTMHGRNISCTILSRCSSGCARSGLALCGKTSGCGGTRCFNDFEVAGECGPKNWTYCEMVRFGGDASRQSLGNPALSGDDVDVLNAILSHCEVVTSHWGEVREICRLVPQTLVHGDFSAKNVRSRKGQNGLELLPLGWDDARWGDAAADFSQTDA